MKLDYLQSRMTESRTQCIGAKESTEAKPERRYEKLCYICNPKSLIIIAIQSVTEVIQTF